MRGLCDRIIFGQDYEAIGFEQDWFLLNFIILSKNHPVNDVVDLFSKRLK
jgi:hypothetical protein